MGEPPKTFKRMVMDSFAGNFLRAGKGLANRCGEGLIARYVAPGQFRKYLAEAQQPRMHLGSGPRNFPGWLNIDFFRPAMHYLRTDPRVAPLDLRRTLPFADSTFDYVYSEHMHEHIPYRDGQRLAAEVRRVLKPGGVFRCSAPNLDILMEIYRRGLLPEEVPLFEWGCNFFGFDEKGEPRNAVSLINHIVGEPLHEYCYDSATLISQMLDAGYSSAERVAPGESEHGPLRNLETSPLGRRDDKVMLGYIAWITLSIEATK